MFLVHGEIITTAYSKLPRPFELASGNIVMRGNAHHGEAPRIYSVANIYPSNFDKLFYMPRPLIHVPSKINDRGKRITIYG